jgi:Zn-dependent protease/predicted transcriptional regulator
MNRQSLSLGKVFGISLSVDLSWFLVMAMLTWTFAVGYYPSEFKNWPLAEYWITGGVTAVLLFGCVLLHELGHSFTALRFKIPVKGITLYIFGGISQISEEPKNAASEFWITIAGPAVSLVLAGVFTLLAPFLTGLLPVLAVVKYLAYANLLLGLFNLIPGFPLDGGGVLMAIVWGITRNRHRSILVAAYAGRVVAYLLILLGAYMMFAGGLVNGLWTAFMGWFLLDASGGQVQHEKVRTLLAGHQVFEAMNRAYTTIQADTTLQFLIDHQILGGSRRSFIVVEGSQVVGLLTLHQVSAIPREKWAETIASQAMLPLDKLKQINPDTGLWDAIEEMDQDGVNQLPVMRAGQIEGMLTREDIISFLRRLEPGNPY